MDTVYSTLRRLRDWFFVWFGIEAVAGTAAAAYTLDGLRRHSLLRHSTVGTVLAGLGVSLVLLIIACLVLEALIGLRPWARVVMLVVGWITVVSAAINLLALPASSALLAPLVRLRSGDWAALLAVSALTKAADLAFWSWVIYELQMNQTVRAAFGRRSPSSAML
jgi:hypothetical protein